MHTSGRIIFFVVDLIDCAQSFDEMGRRIDVRSLLLDVSEKLRKKSFSHQSGLLVVPIMVLRFSSGKPDHRGMPRASSCVKSTKFLWLMIFWISVWDMSACA